MEKNRKKSVVVIGGGTGTHTLLKGLKKYADQIDIAAIVTMADSGGSTGRLRDEFGYLPVGDARSALAALARETNEDEDTLRRLFLYRFDRGEGLMGHTFGNLFLVALTDILGSEAKAIEAAGKVLATCGDVIPVTHEHAQLVARFSSGEILTNEHDIDEGKSVSRDARIEELWLSPRAHMSERAERAIAQADMIVLGPGDFYTSILANVIVSGVSEALVATKGKLLYIANLMSRRGQTHGMGTWAYQEEIIRYAGRTPDYMIVHAGAVREDLLIHYAQEGEHRVVHDYAGQDTKVIWEDIVSTDDVILAKGDMVRRSLIRHDSERLARVIIELL
jgi:uncharacterized cofD-like protein